MHIVVNKDIVHGMTVTNADQIPEALQPCATAIFCQSTMPGYYTSSLTLRIGDETVVYDFYSEQAWIDMLVERKVQERLAPYREAETIAEIEERIDREVQYRVQSQVTQYRQQKQGKGALIYHIIDRETELPVYVGQTTQTLQARMSQHLKTALTTGGLYVYLREKHAARALPMVREVKRVSAYDVRRAELAEIYRLINDGVTLFNAESHRVATAALYATQFQMLPTPLQIEGTKE